jgi:hypothetical protein
MALVLLELVTFFNRNKINQKALSANLIGLF